VLGANFIMKLIPCCIQITLPTLVESEKSRKALATTFRKSRDRFRQFRGNLSIEVRQSKGKENANFVISLYKLGN
jgi:hypothetical protein